MPVPTSPADWRCSCRRVCGFECDFEKERFPVPHQLKEGEQIGITKPTSSSVQHRITLPCRTLSLLAEPGDLVMPRDREADREADLDGGEGMDGEGISADMDGISKRANSK